MDALDEENKELVAELFVIASGGGVVVVHLISRKSFTASCMMRRRPDGRINALRYASIAAST